MRLKSTRKKQAERIGWMGGGRPEQNFMFNTKQLCDVLFETLLLGLWHKYQSMRDTIFPLGCEIAKHAFKSLPETPNIGSSDPRLGTGVYH